VLREAAVTPNTKRTQRLRGVCERRRVQDDFRDCLAAAWRAGSRRARTRRLPAAPSAKVNSAPNGAGPPWAESKQSGALACGRRLALRQCGPCSGNPAGVLHVGPGGGRGPSLTSRAPSGASKPDTDACKASAGRAQRQCADTKAFHRCAEPVALHL
jgi:hypothetical protein